MFIYNLFVITYTFTSLLCFIIEMSMPGVRYYTISENKILINYYDMLPTVIINLLIAYPYFYYIEPYIIYPNLNTDNIYWYLSLVYYFILWLILSDMFFYTIHRLFHHKKLYWLHSKHHKYRYTHGMGAIYASIPDFIICNLVPLTLPIMIMNIPYDYVKMIVIFSSFTTVFVSHSGFIWFNTHLFHHLKFTVNYGFMISDKLFGTKM